MNENNFNAYRTAKVVNHYAQLKILQPAETMLLERLRDRLPRMKMLDIGVGGGRTAQHFAQMVADYTGIDYSSAMIEACQQRFANLPQAQFEVCDARDMSRFSDRSFDLILFSFNGIDSVSETDRLRIFQEVQRVGKPGSYFFFSTHNLQGLEASFKLTDHLSLNPFSTYVNLFMWGLLRLLNRSLTPQRLQASNTAVVRDESHNFSLKNYYIRPEAQIAQLEPFFQDIQIYPWQNTQEITDRQELLQNRSMWFYYLCTVREAPLGQS
ncbi:MAG TPA: class I SAM-dependent methyltransferase [Stenomitos sp.]